MKNQRDRTEVMEIKANGKIEAESFERKKSLGHSRISSDDHSSQWLRRSKQEIGKDRRSADVFEKTACDVYVCDGIFKAQDFRTCIYVECKKHQQMRDELGMGDIFTIEST